MGFRALARFKCDGCKVIESDGIEVLSDIMQAATPDDWRRVETNRRDGQLNLLEVRFFCRKCAPLIESYLKGARE